MGARHAEVDAELVLLLRLLWDRGVATTMSCQGSPDSRAFVLFPDSSGADTMLALSLEIAEGQRDLELSRRIRQRTEWRGGDRRLETDNWLVAGVPQLWWAADDRPPHQSGGLLNFAVRFPHAHLHRLNRHLAAGD